MPAPIAPPSITSFVPSTKIESAKVNTNFNLMRGHWLPLDASISAFAHRAYQLGDSTNSWTSIYGEKLFLNLTGSASFLQANTNGSISVFISNTAVAVFDNTGIDFSPRVIAAQTIASGGTITLQSGRAPQYLKVIGNGTATASSSPFNTTPAFPIEVSLIGQDNSNPLIIFHADTAGGCIINGTYMILGVNDIGNFIYDSTNDRYIEKSRNF